MAAAAPIGSTHGNGIHVRPALAADVPSMVELLESLFGIEADFQPDPDRQARGLALLLERHPSECRVSVAEADGAVVGMATAQGLVSTAQGSRVAMVEDVVVAAPWRGQGVGKRLLADLEGWARLYGMTRLQLLADRENGEALRFYGRAGWRPTRLVGLRRLLETP